MMAGFDTWMDYPHISRSYWYSLIFILPLVALYEFLSIIVNWSSAVELRNGADILLRQLLDLFGLYTPYFMGALFVGVIVAAWFRHHRVHGSHRVEGKYLIAMFGESLLWAVVLFGILQLIPLSPERLSAPDGDTVLQNAFLAIGAGIYEEGLFRLVLITLLAALFKNVFRWQKTPSVALAVLASALLFSLFHYIGPAGEPFGWNSFGHRIVAGLFLGVLFVARGFGITAYAHTSYDLLVLSIRTVVI